MITIVNKKTNRRFTFPMSFIFNKIEKTRKKRANIEQLHKFIQLMIDVAWDSQRDTDNYGVYCYPFRISDGSVCEFDKDVLVFKSEWTLTPESLPYLKGGKEHFNTIILGYDVSNGESVYDNIIKIDN